MSIPLPPLPKKSTLYYKDGLKYGEASHAYGYTADQLRAIVRAAAEIGRSAS